MKIANSLLERPGDYWFATSRAASSFVIVFRRAKGGSSRKMCNNRCRPSRTSRPWACRCVGIKEKHARLNLRPWTLRVITECRGKAFSKEKASQQVGKSLHSSRMSKTWQGFSQHNSRRRQQQQHTNYEQQKFWKIVWFFFSVVASAEWVRVVFFLTAWIYVLIPHRSMWVCKELEYNTVLWWTNLMKDDWTHFPKQRANEIPSLLWDVTFQRQASYWSLLTYTISQKVGHSLWN